MSNKIKINGILGKPISFLCSSGFDKKYGGLEVAVYVTEAFNILQEYPVDMLIFEMIEEQKMGIRIHGYPLIQEEGNTMIKYPMDKVVRSFRSLPTDKFWLKIDDYGDRFIGTFLFPSEY